MHFLALSRVLIGNFWTYSIVDLNESLSGQAPFFTVQLYTVFPVQYKLGHCNHGLILPSPRPALLFQLQQSDTVLHVHRNIIIPLVPNGRSCNYSFLRSDIAAELLPFFMNGTNESFVNSEEINKLLKANICRLITISQRKLANTIFSRVASIDDDSGRLSSELSTVAD